MRNIVIFSDNGTYSPYIGDCTINLKSKKLLKTFFKNDGQIICVPFLESLKDFYNELNDLQICDNLNKINDSHKIWIIFNQIISNPNEWDKNRFLSKLFKHDIYADNICMFISEDELNNGAINVSDDIYEDFQNKVFEICEAVIKKFNSYFDKIEIYLSDEEIITLDDTAANTYQDEYIGKRNELKFSEVIELNSDNVLIRKNGALIHSYNNIAEFYFCPMYKCYDDLEMFKEILN